MTTLADVRVLDLSDGPAGRYCAGLFATYGADVVAIRPPGNASGPLDEDKSLLGLDIGTATGRAIIRKLVEGANLVVETFPAGKLDSMGLGYAALHGIKRRIILTSIDAPDDDLQTAYFAGLNAFAAAAIAAHNADAYEVPQHITISAAECLAFASATSFPLENIDPATPLFQMSEVERTEPEDLTDTADILVEELGLPPRALALLRAAGVI
jgi:crotonobetainyl-CoA:carnitine CoA-transferase CaiB-like acyl-CoA transferase